LLGGVCLNWGCIPTKALLRTAELYSEVRDHGAEWGFEAENLKVNWDQVIQRSRNVTGTLNNGVQFLFKKNKITHIQGHARIVRGSTPTLPAEVEVSDAPGGTKQQSLTATRILIATGASPREMPFAPFDGETVIAAKDAMIMKERPDSMVIVGAGAIGCEFAYFYNAFGTKVTIVEMLDQLLPIEDVDVAKVLNREFKKSGIDVKVKHTVKAIDKKSGGGATVTIAKVDDDSKTETIDADTVLVAVGVRGRYDGLFDDSLRLETFKDHLKVDYMNVENPTYQTSVPGVYAIGDVIGPPWLAHVASEEGIACVERMAGEDVLGVDYDLIPGCTYCNPQVASVGKTEKALIEAGMKKGEDYKVGQFQFKGHGKAIAAGHNVGLVKVLSSIPHGEILGAHIIGAEATEMIGEFALAMSVEATTEDLIATIHAHPTMYEAIHESVLAAEGRLIHG
jgi:dihydrolipoamide dehydrogenase